MSVVKYNLKVGFEVAPKYTGVVSAYVFDLTGKLLFTVPVKDGTISFDADSTQMKSVRMFIGPSLTDKSASAICLDTMKKINAYEPVLGTTLSNPTAALLPVPKLYCGTWSFDTCRVLGRVVRSIQHDNTVTNLPVLNARVHVCEVDKYIINIYAIPKDTLNILVQNIIDQIRHPNPPPPPPDGYRFDIRTVDPSPERIAEMNSTVLKSNVNQVVLSAVAVNPVLITPLKTVISPLNLAPVMNASLTKFADDLQTVYSTGSSDKMYSLLNANQGLWAKYIPNFPWLDKYTYDVDEQAVAYTDANGRFEVDLGYYTGDDHPDIYFWVEYCIGGAWETVYKPGVGATTIWDYPSGTETTITITDPRVPGNDPTPKPVGKSVAILGIGQKRVTQIQGLAAGSNQGLTVNGEPFGGSVEPVLSLSPDLKANGICYYRWSYRKVGDTPFTAMDAPVFRHYAEIMPDRRQVFKAYQIGPKSTATDVNLFEIEPTVPAPSSGGSTTFWTPQINPRVNAASAYFLTHLLRGGNAADSAGKYELKLELFTAAGSLVNFTDSNIVLQISASTVADPLATQVIPVTAAVQPPNMEDYLVRDAATNKVIAFKMKLQVDNNPCVAGIDPAVLVGGTTEPCGFMRYNTSADNVTISYTASHPNGYAYYNFTTVRGNTGQVNSASANSLVNSGNSPMVRATPVNGFVIDPVSNKHKKNVTVSDLLEGHLDSNGHSCTMGAFCSTIYVYALAIDGYSRLYYLDASDTPKAFALVQKTV